MPIEKRDEIPVSKLFEAVLPYQSSVYVTALNIIQALALGFWLNEARNVVVAGNITIEWLLRSLAALGVILVVWHRYAAELQYLWPIVWINTLGPFAIGVLECLLVFSINTEVSLLLFVTFFTSLQFMAAAAYGYAHSMRKTELTEKLYREFYHEYPHFVSCLTSFLKENNKLSCLWYMAFAGGSLVILLLLQVLPERLAEILFPVIYITELISGEVTGRFEKLRSTDKFLGPYFQSKEIS